MRDAVIPDRLIAMHTYFIRRDDDGTIVPFVLPLGEAYLTYVIEFGEVTAPDGSKHLGMVQTVGISPAPNKPSAIIGLDAGKENKTAFLCGAIIQTGDDIRFLHLDTIRELMRSGMRMYADTVLRLRDEQVQEIERHRTMIETMTGGVS